MAHGHLESAQASRPGICVLVASLLCLAADLENLIFLIFLISSLQSIRDSAPRGIIGDPRLVPDTMARRAEGSPEGAIHDVRDPHLSLKAKPCGPIPTTTTTVASQLRWHTPVRANSTSDMHEMS